jgi:hypothetical protein
MDTTQPTLERLFQQLGLPDSPEEIRRFVTRHRPLADGVRLAEAPFWSPAQAQFLGEELGGDAEWAEVVDQLNLMLRA